MRRRLDIAASIVVTPELMFLDEPTTGLDPRSRNQVWDIIRALVAEGTTILLCTQYLEEADQLCEGIAVIDHGKVIAEGTPSELKASVGSGALHVRLLDPEQRSDAAAGARARARRGRARGRPGSAVGRVLRRRPRRRGGRRADPRGRADRRLLARPAEPRRGLPGPHRPHRGGRRRRTRRAARSRQHEHRPHNPARRRAGGRRGAVRKAISSIARPPRPSAAVGRADVRLARDAQGQARPRAAARRDDHAGDVRR